MQNVVEYAKSLEIDVNEVMSYLALQELAHSRLYASVPWLMPRFEALLGKYARGTSIDLDAMEEQIRDAQSVDPDSMADAVNITKVAFPDTPEQQQAMEIAGESARLGRGLGRHRSVARRRSSYSAYRTAS